MQSIFKTRSLPRTLHLGSFLLVLKPLFLCPAWNPRLPAFCGGPQRPFDHSPQAIQAILTVLFSIPKPLSVNSQNSGFRDPAPLRLPQSLQNVTRKCRTAAEIPGQLCLRIDFIDVLASRTGTAHVGNSQLR
jgi:hypothetical protein